MQASPPPSSGPQSPPPSLLRQWVVAVVLPLTLATLLASGLLWLAHYRLATSLQAGVQSGAAWLPVGLMFAALAVVLVASWGIARRFHASLDSLTQAVERLGKGLPVQLALDQRSNPLWQLQHAIHEAARAVSQMQNRMQTALGRTSIELAEKNATLESASLSRARLLAAASHDLRQPLYALTLFSSTLRAGETDPDKLTRILHIQECVASLDQLFTELLDLSRLETGSMQASNAAMRLDDVFDEVSRNFRMLAESRGLRLVVRKTDAWVHSDRTMLARILNNLVSNALRYTDAGGVLVGVRQLDSGQVRIDVWDTGCGIAPEHLQRVFDEFYQVKQNTTAAGERKRGMGLGLATVRRLAELCGCHLALQSRPGRGTLVSIVLDRSDAQAAAASDGFELPLDISGLRILAIDDEPSILEGLRTLLQEWGCQVRTAHDIDSALAQLEDWIVPPDLILSDLHLGENLSGLDVLDAVSRRYRCDPQHPAFARLLVTGETRPDKIETITARRIPVLFKPVAPQRLREVMLAAVMAAKALPREIDT
ncbi:MAG: response regulator [Xanthomonadaceae bacterium]|nr:response regulator [Xanthomonadaceae bacterium]